MPLKKKMNRMIIRKRANKLVTGIVFQILDESYPLDIRNYQKSIQALTDFDESHYGKHVSISDLVSHDFKLEHGTDDMRTVNRLCSTLNLFHERYSVVMTLIDNASIIALYTDIKVFDPDDPMTTFIRNCKVKALRQLDEASLNAHLGLWMS